jgi:branched-chain amino acid transport system substrate-binding protein
VKITNRFRSVAVLAALAALIAHTPLDQTFAADPIKVGFSMALTGAIAGNGKAALLATQMWADDQNAKGGLQGRPVELIYYDDQSNPSLVPGIYTKLFDIDKVDLVISGYGTNIIGPAMPLVMKHNKVFMSLAGLRVNEQFHYDKYFQIQPLGPDAHLTFAQGFFEVAMTMDPKPKTVAIWSPIRNFRRPPQSARANGQRNTGSTSPMIAAFRPTRSTLLRSCVRSRRPSRTSCTSRAFRPILLVSCAPFAKPGSSRG